MMVMVILCALIFLLLVFVGSVTFKTSPLSIFELKRRQAEGDNEAKAILRRQSLLEDIKTVQRVKISLLLVIFGWLSIITFSWGWGILLTVIVILFYGPFSRLTFLHKFAQKQYDRLEPALLNFVEKFHSTFRIFRGPSVSSPTKRIDSREELTHLVEESDVLSSSEKKLITHGLQFDHRLASTVMTPRKDINSISKKELLGPLVLDDLHKTGHTHFPVIDGNINQIVGILSIQSLLTIDSTRRSTTVEKAMDSNVVYIQEDQTLDQALTALIKAHAHLLIVLNDEQKTVGLINLKDLIRALTGRQLND